MGYGTSLGTAHEDEISYVLEKGMTDKKLSDAREIGFNQTSSDFQSRFYATDQSTMPLEASRKLTDALKSFGSAGTPENDYNTKLTPDQETSFQSWKQKNAPNDSGADYDLRGAFQAGLGRSSPDDHLPDTYKKPNHPTFSDQSMYTKYAPDKAGTWDGDRYIPPVQRSSIADDFFGKGTNDIRPALMKAGEGIKNAFALPGDVLSGKVQAGSVQEIERATDLAGLLITGPAPVAAKMADGSLGSFMGVKSKTIDKTRLYKAQEMEMDAVHPDIIWDQTKTTRGAEGRWKQEIDDSKSSLNMKTFDTTITPATEGSTGMWDIGGREAEHTVSLKENPTDIFGKSKPVMLNQAFDHPELFKAYPELNETKIATLPKYFVDRGVKGMMAQGDNTLYIAPNLHPGYVRSVILHEAQHRIQEIEGFAKGGSTWDFLPAKLPEAEQLLEDAKNTVLPQIKEKGFSDREINTIKWASTLDKDTFEILEKNSDSAVKLLDRAKEAGVFKQIQNIGRSEDLLKAAKEEARDKYNRLMGEVEARNVQVRRDFNDFDRNTQPPHTTEDIRRIHQFDREGTRDNAMSEEPTQFRRAANDNIGDRVATGNKKSDEALDKFLSDNKFEKNLSSLKDTQHLFDERMKILNKTRDTGMSEVDAARYNKLGKEEADHHGWTWEPIKSDMTPERIQYQLRKEVIHQSEDKLNQAGELLSKKDFNSADAKLIKKLMDEHEALNESIKR